MAQWGFESSSGNLCHASGQFFKIEGIWVETNYGHRQTWTQPIINQPEIGILGFITATFDDVLHFLVQAKMEPGNLHTVQLAPTVQATRSNFMRVHNGNRVPYLEYFAGHQKATTIVDVLQSEQGARFLRKRNRNVIVEVFDDLPVYEGYCWLTLGQIQSLILLDNVINMDARTVLAHVPFRSPRLESATESHVRDYESAYRDIRSASSEFSDSIVGSLLEVGCPMHSVDEILTWFTRVKFLYHLNVEKIPLKLVAEWVRSESELSHIAQRYFSVIAVSVETDSREVSSWCQPLLKPREPGVVGFITRKIGGTLHVLVQAKVESGNFDILEMAPTVQCLTGSYRDVPAELRPPFLDWMLEAPHQQVRHRSFQSEEGGRFYEEQNLNLVIEADDSFPIDVPDTYTWMTVCQLKEFIRYNNFVNVQARCLLSCLQACS